VTGSAADGSCARGSGVKPDSPPANPSNTLTRPIHEPTIGDTLTAELRRIARDIDLNPDPPKGHGEMTWLVAAFQSRRATLLQDLNACRRMDAEHGTAAYRVRLRARTMDELAECERALDLVGAPYEWEDDDG
jgi:hypothetical protein